MKALRVVRRAGVGAGEVGVADPCGDESQRDVLELDLDLGLQADAERLGAFGELAADRVVVGRLGEDGHALRAGSFWLRRENTGVGHRIEVGPEGMRLVTMGDLIPGDVCVYPEKRTFKPARGLELPY